MAYFWLSANIFSIIVLAFYSMLEMAIVSLNKVRLQYYVSIGSKRAIWLNYLIHDPARLFGTTLIGVNVATVIGSECAREFNTAIGIDPNLAPLSQILLVIIFGELAPMFAARHYPEHVSMLGIPIVYFSSKVMAPIIWIFGKISSFTLKFIQKNADKPNVFLSQDELMRIVEEQNEDYIYENEGEESVITANIFRLHEKNIQMVMTPIEKVPKLPSDATVVQLKTFLTKHSVDFVPIYHKKPEEIIGVIFPRDLLRVSETKRIRDCSRPPWFITQASKLNEILKQFKSNKESVAIVLNQQGNTVGVITLNSLLSEVFGKEDQIKIKKSQKHFLFLEDCKISGEITVKQFNKTYEANLTLKEDLTLSEIIVNTLGHPPEIGDQVTIGDFQMMVTEVSLLGVKMLNVNSINH